jgi:hypothetical protein
MRINIMFFKKLVSFLNRWGSIFVILISYPFLPWISVTYNPADYSKLKDIVELLSWLFSGIMSLIAFSTLFIAFTYENKLIAASNNLKSYLNPYALNTEEIRLHLINYKQNLVEDILLKYLYYVFILFSSLLTLIWGSVVGFYTSFKVSSRIDLSISSMLGFGAYTFFIILGLLFFLLAIVIKSVRNNRDPLDIGYLPSPQDVCNVDFMVKKDADMKEFFSKNYLSFIFYKNPPYKTPKCEFILDLPIKVSNLRFVFRIYNEEDEGFLTCFGLLDKRLTPQEIGKRSVNVIDGNINKNIYDHLYKQDFYGILKLYDENFNVVAVYSYSKRSEDEKSFSFIYDKVIESYFKFKDNDRNLIVSSKGLIRYQQEYEIQL